MSREARSRVIETKNNGIHVVFDEETNHNLLLIKAKCKEIFSRPFTEQDCENLLDTIIDMQFSYSDDIADLEDVIQGSVDFFELLESRLKEGVAP